MTKKKVTAKPKKAKQELAVQPVKKRVMFDQEQINLITKTVAKGATLPELQLFLYTANKVGLDPLARQIHFVKRRTKQKDGTYTEVGTIQTGIDGLRAIAERSKTYAGSDDVVYDDEKATRPNKATVTVYRVIGGVRVPFTATARWKEFYPGEHLGFMWNKMPFHMLGKVAEALALRKAFPQDLSGLYTEEEMQKADADAIRVEKTVEPKVKVGVDMGIGDDRTVIEKVEVKEAQVTEAPQIDFECSECANPITKAEKQYSENIYGRALCRECQKLAKDGVIKTNK